MFQANLFVSDGPNSLNHSIVNQSIEFNSSFLRKYFKIGDGEMKITKKNCEFFVSSAFSFDRNTRRHQKMDMK